MNDTGKQAYVQCQQCFVMSPKLNSKPSASYRIGTCTSDSNIKPGIYTGDSIQFCYAIRNSIQTIELQLHFDIHVCDAHLIVNLYLYLIPESNFCDTFEWKARVDFQAHSVSVKQFAK